MLSVLTLRNSLTKLSLSRTIFTTTLLKDQVNDQPVLETREITKDRTEQIPVETSIRYLKSAAFQKTYEGKPVWVPYRRNHKGVFAPKKTRKTCIRAGQISTGNPCPICRDEYLVLHEENIDLLKQFICPYTGSILSYSKTGLCQKKHQQLIVSIQRAFDKAHFVVIGGGIAGVTCAENLSLLEPEKTVVLLSESRLIKSVTNLRAITKVLTSFDIEEINTDEFTSNHPNITIVHDTLSKINDEERSIETSQNRLIKYQYLCICSGAEPKLIPQASDFPQILGIRDTDSVEYFVKKIRDAKRVVIVGNGGIASELVYKIRNAEIFWVIKDKHITATFVDPGAAEFFQTSLVNSETTEEPVSKRMRYKENEFKKSGAALGPDWYKDLFIGGANNVDVPPSVNIHYESEIESVGKIRDSEFPLEVALTTGKKLQCDLIISATGVSPRTSFQTKNHLEVSEDGGIKVNEFMQTNIPYIYAAGDVCDVNWLLAKHWFQRKLWTQARQMGCYAAKCMVGHMNKEEVLQDFCFEMFAHSTRLFGHKVILLGLYNGQKLGTDYEILIRMTKGMEYIKFVLQNDKLQGAVLIGETDLEEMAENLILNQIDLSPYGDDILNPDVDIEDYFD
ncbi:hypothetical protein JTB14_006307 [Gonioctena quinquepunctata]|nr:hypothetical protein JTB14_006307 [Gonioctena quinquepunctata]